MMVLPLSGQNLLEVEPSSLDFGNVEHGQADSLEVTVTNLSSETIFLDDLIFFDVYQSTPFKVNQYQEEIQASSSVSFYVVFEPVHNISHNSELIIKTDGNIGAFSVDLQGACTYTNDYYDGTEDLLDQDLKEALNEIISDGYMVRGYDEARDEMYMVIDNQQVNGQGSSQTRLTRAYLGTDAVGYTSRSDLFNNYDINCEHTFPQSFFNQNIPMRSDVHHLFPTDINANSTRGNLRFGEVESNIDWSEGGSLRGNDASGNQVFEPRNGQKGRTARAVLYFVVRYENYGGFLSQNMEETLKEWHFEFPVDEVDRQRNDDIFDFQNNRNPFVDYPQFVHRIYSFRTEEDRPNVGILELSHDEIEFGAVAQETVFNLVLVNRGERFFSISDIATSGSGFSLAEGQETGFVVIPGEAVNIRIAFDPSVNQGFSAGTLNILTNLSGNENLQIPLSADGILSTEDFVTSVVNIHPNPTADKFRIEAGSSHMERVELLDSSGRVVKTFPGNQQVFEVGDLASGLYVVRLTETTGDMASSRLLITRGY